jgi:glycerate kinase
LRDADLVITGEGRIDAQTCFGKTISGIARACRQRGIPAVAVTGMRGEGAEAVFDVGVEAIWTIVDRPMSLEEAMADCHSLLERAGEGIARMLIAGSKSIKR